MDSIIEQWARCWNDNNAERLAALYHESRTISSARIRGWTSDGGPLHGRRQALSYWQYHQPTPEPFHIDLLYWSRDGGVIDFVYKLDSGQHVLEHFELDSATGLILNARGTTLKSLHDSSQV